MPSMDFEGGEREEKEKKKEKVVYAKPDDLCPHTLPLRGGEAKANQILSWKMVFDQRATPHGAAQRV